MGDLLTVADLEVAKKHDTFHSEVITGKAGGVAGGASIDYATNAVTGQQQKTLPKQLSDEASEHDAQIALHETEHDTQIAAHESEHDAQISAHEAEHDNQIATHEAEFKSRLLAMRFTPVGSFTTGYDSLTDARQTLLNTDGRYYSWAGSFPHVVAAGTDPLSDTINWIDRTEDQLRDEVYATVRESIRRSYAEAGFNLVDGSFEAGGTLVNANDVLLQERTGKAFSGPVGVVAAGTNPERGGFVDKSGGLLRHELAAPDSDVLVGGVAARNSFYYRQAPDPLSTSVGTRGFSLLIGEGAIQHIDNPGAGCVLFGGSTDQKNRLIGYGLLRGIVGGYDNEITGDTNNVGGLACFIVGSHHSEIQGNTTHGFISGGSYNRILSGDYGNILGGTANEIRAVRADDVTPVICHTSTICGGLNNIITNSNSFIGGGRNNSCDGAYSFVGSGRGLNAAGEFCVVSGGAENQTLRGPSGSGQQNTISGGRDNLIDSATGSPQQSTIGGGNTNKIYGTQSTISGGWTNSIGSISQNTNGAAIGGGQRHIVLADLSVISGGRDNTINADGTYGSITGGRLNQVTALYARAGGHQAVARHAGGDTWADGAFAVAGDAQTSVVMRRVQTTNATLTSMTTIALPDNSTYMFEVSIVARRTDAVNESAAYKITGCIDRNTGAASTASVGTPVVTVIAEDVADWNAAVIANASSGGLTIQVTGQADKTIRWVARVELVEVSA